MSELDGTVARLRTLVAAQEAERERIRLELHDGAAQTLAHAFQCLQAVEATPDVRLPEMRPSIAKAAGSIRDAMREIREVMHTLRPASLDTVGLIRTLEGELEDLGGSLVVELDADAVALPRPVETALYRIAREALHNVVRHAMARRVVVRLATREGSVRLVVQDDGVGFDPREVFERGRGRCDGIGLLSMRAHAELLHGTLAVTSAPGAGTTIEIDVPVTVR